MRKHIVLFGALIVGFAVAGAIWLRATPAPLVPPQAPSVGTPVASPATISVNVPVTVTVTVQITDPSVIANGVNLLRLNATGTQSTILGVMHDDGANGDVGANDKIFTLQITLTEVTAGQVQIQISTAFRGQLKRVVSSPVNIAVWNSTLTTMGVRVGYPPGWELQPLEGPSGLDGIVIEDPKRIEYDESVSILLIKHTSTTDTIAALGASDVLNSYTVNTPTGQWLILLHRDTAAIHTLITALSQRGPDVVVIASTNSQRNLDLISLLIPMIK